MADILSTKSLLQVKGWGANKTGTKYQCRLCSHLDKKGKVIITPGRLGYDYKSITVVVIDGIATTYESCGNCAKVLKEVLEFTGEVVPGREEYIAWAESIWSANESKTEEDLSLREKYLLKVSGEFLDRALGTWNISNTASGTDFNKHKSNRKKTKRVYYV